VRLAGPDGERIVPVESLYQRDGVHHLTLAPNEIVSHIELPPPWPGLHSAYYKLRIRKAVDFPVLSLAVAAALDAQRCVQRLAIVGTALMATPRRLGGAEDVARGRPLTEEVRTALAERAFKQFVPLTNIAVDPDWRHEMVPVCLRRALDALVPSREVVSP
jgi:CO/xanthine dehydrogenase FAD-binding subunit